MMHNARFAIYLWSNNLNAISHDNCHCTCHGLIRMMISQLQLFLSGVIEQCNIQLGDEEYNMKQDITQHKYSQFSKTNHDYEANTYMIHNRRCVIYLNTWMIFLHDFQYA